jgi:hypothetical protein
MLRVLSDLAKTVLVVDSDPMGVKLAAAMLRAEGYAAPTRDAPPAKTPTRKPADGEA